MTKEITPEQRSKLAEMIMEASRHSWFDDIRSDDDERALILVDEIIKMGWAPAEESFVEEWKVIPGYSFWEMSKTGMIRHRMSKVGIELWFHPGDVVVALIHDDQGNEVEVAWSELKQHTWPVAVETEADINLNEMFPEAKVFTLQFENGNSVEMPVGQLLPGSTPVEVLPEEEWRNIDSILGLESFQVSDIGRIRYKHNDRVIEPSFDCLTNKHYVKLKVNGKDLWIDGPVLAASMWATKVIEWRKIPGFSGYIISKDGDVMLADGPEDPHPASVHPVSSNFTHPRRYNLLGDDNRGHEKREQAFVALAFPELEF